jgi:alginate O-acetyltransferase complex protein AlgI
MISTSIDFLIFFPLTTLIYYLTPARYRSTILLISSYFFYINVKPVFALLLAGVTISTYFFTILMSSTKDESRRRLFAIINVVLVLIPLFFFKYFAEINSGMIILLKSFNLNWPLPEYSLLLPVGISFYTFTAIGYTLDVYNEELDAEKNFGIISLFISFFPLVLSGPIERATNLLPQFRQKQIFKYDNLIAGLKLILWGYFMKLVVADRIIIYIHAVFNNASQHNGTTLLFASFLRPLQIYADFGGYSLIAIGTSRILGIYVMSNFNRPFFATSIGELWRRWHISLILWLTKYIYTPLTFVFRKYKMWGIIMAIIITFVLSGIWHGAKLTYVVWGLMQGVFLSIEALTRDRRNAFEKRYKLNHEAWYIFLSIVLTIILLTSSYIFGEAKSIKDGLFVYSKIFTDSGPLFIGQPTEFILSIFGILMLLLKDFSDEFFPSGIRFFENKNLFVRLISYCSIVLLILLFGVFDGGQFIYFQF